jgi:L-aspartate oxidase
MEPHPLDGQPVVIGAGIAGLMIALRLAPQPVTVLSGARLGLLASSALAQGGIAASLGADDDTGLHLADTLAAGDGLCDAAMARRIIEAAPGAVEQLARLGARFDLGPDGAPRLGREAAHSRRRIVHASGDGTGWEIMRALIEAVRGTPSVTVLEGVEARRLLTDGDAVTGVLAVGPSGAFRLATQRVAIATGGIGGLFRDTSNPPRCFGHGLALAARAGAALADLEFIQFHPTALDVAAHPKPLITEAVRGEGAVLVNEAGERFMADEPGAELATRDVVARAVWRQIADGRRVFLDARHAIGPRFAARFPTVAAYCREHGYDPAADLLPVRPAAHYHMGGIAVDAAGRSTVRGLWACGEAACTGLHGANRLASNSLTEAVVHAGWVAESMAGETHPRRVAPSPALALPPSPDPARLRPLVSQALGVERNADRLRRAVHALLPLIAEGRAASDPALVGLMIAIAAFRREESRGAHHRTDFAARAPIAARTTLYLDEALAAARELAASVTPLRMEA